MLEEGFACALLIVLLGALLFGGATLILLAGTILRAILKRVASWVKAQRQKPGLRSITDTLSSLRPQAGGS